VAEPDVFAALANPTRREVLRVLREDGPQPVNRLAERFDMRRPSFSEHLRLLKDAGLVTERRTGRERRYSLRAEPLRELSSWLAPYERFWQQRLTGLADFLDAESAVPDPPPAADHTDEPRERG
jgi:DNA-binding transcriptional ArsR family regulator